MVSEPLQGRELRGRPFLSQTSEKKIITRVGYNGACMVCECWVVLSFFLSTLTC